MPRTLYWFNNDLRLADNPALKLASDAEKLLCVYCVQPQWFKAKRYHTASMGHHRWVFIQAALSELNQSLLKRGQHLLMRYGRPELELGKLIEQHQIDRIVLSRAFGFDERRCLSNLRDRYPDLSFIEVDTTTLFDASTIERSGVRLPSSYAPFRRQTDKLDVPATIDCPALPPLIAHLQSVLELPHWLPRPKGSHSPFTGGEVAAQRHLKSYFSSSAAKVYKTVRNELIGWENSSKLSAWLNIGNLSARQIKQAIDLYETEHGKTDGTEWLYVELLWREFFQWLSLHQGRSLFDFKGLAKQAPLTTFYPDRFKAWCQGSTAYPIVNACMNELRETGYLTNRGRQIAASCLVNELQVDWRYGAAWFEHCLVDYNLGANWGNWQYIAGVGVDPRGGRQFNLQKQTDTFDPDGLYRNQWAGDTTNLTTEDRLDAAGWPIGLVEVPK